MAIRYISETQDTVYDEDSKRSIPIDINNRYYRLIVLPYLDQGNEIEPYIDAITLPKTLPIIEGTTDTERLSSIINILRAEGIAL